MLLLCPSNTVLPSCLLWASLSGLHSPCFLPIAIQWMRSLESSLWDLGKRPMECELRPVSVQGPESPQAAVSSGYPVLMPAPHTNPLKSGTTGLPLFCQVWLGCHIIRPPEWDTSQGEELISNYSGTTNLKSGCAAPLSRLLAVRPSHSFPL